MAVTDTPEQHLHSPSPGSGAAAETPAKRIFIVEDEEVVSDDLEELLILMGYATAGKVASGEEAIEQIPKAQPDLILMDIQLKGKMDGVEAARILTSSQLEIPIVYLTAHHNQAIMDRLELTTPFGFILKPFDERELRIIIEIALYRSATEAKLKKLNRELQAALCTVETLTNLLPICSWCKKVRSDRGLWEKLEDYITSHSRSQLTHSVCPDCAAKFGLTVE